MARLFQYLDACFVTVNDSAAEQTVAHQVQQRLEMLAALDDPTRQGLPGAIDVVTPQHFLEAIKGQTIDVLGGEQPRQP